MSATETSTAATDADLIASCAAVIDVPKAAPPDSFMLHAPLELLARAILLERVPSETRPAARERLQWLADTYAEAGPGMDPVATRHRPRHRRHRRRASPRRDMRRSC